MQNSQKRAQELFIICGDDATILSIIGKICFTKYDLALLPLQ
jgi:hypothetical protein